MVATPTSSRSVSSLGSIVCLLAPTVFHRVGERRARAARLVWAIRLQVLGIVLLATALLSASWCVVRLVFGSAAANVVAIGGVVLLAGLWAVLPRTFRVRSR